MKLDLTSLQNAVSALERSLKFLNSDMAKDPALHEQFRSAAIQAFEFTHDLAFKMLKRQLEQMAGDPGSVDKMTYMEVIRTGAEAGLLEDVAGFREYRDKRNITSHTYDQAKAEEIAAVLSDFLRDMRRFLDELERRNRAAD